MYILGIDGGGTHTRMELRTSENKFLRRDQLGPFNLAAIGETQFRQRLQEVFAFCGKPELLQSICIGGAGSSGGQMECILREMLTEAGFQGKLTLLGDHEIALRGAFDGPGCILIAGTGSICCGRNADGLFARVGGWGHLLDDVGSGYAIGKEALSAALRTEDGRLPSNALHAAVMKHLGAANPADVIQFVYFSPASKQEVAALAPIVIDCAESGDPISVQLLQNQAGLLAQMVEALCTQLKMSHPKLSLLGGLLEQDNLYSRMVREVLAPMVTIVPAAHDPLWGAAQTAYESVR